MYDSEALDAKMPPPWQDLRAMYPKSPDCTLKRIHGAKILPSSARKACISRKRCQGGTSFRAISEKRIHAAQLLPHEMIIATSPKTTSRAQQSNRRAECQPKGRPSNNSQIAQHQGDTHETIVLGTPKQRSNQPDTKAVAARTSTLAT